MRVALCSDEVYPVHADVEQLLTERGHQIVPFGSILSGQQTPWADAAERAAVSVACGECDEGILFCWSGTGATIAANKVAGIRAALCSDPGQARAARVWNHANVLCLSNRTLSADMAREILDAWWAPEDESRGDEGVRRLLAVEQRHRR